MHNLGDYIVLLINTIEERSRNRIIAVRLGIFKGLAEALWIAIIFTARIKALWIDLANKLVQTIGIFKHKFNLLLGGRLDRRDIIADEEVVARLLVQRDIGLGAEVLVHRAVVVEVLFVEV